MKTITRYLSAKDMEECLNKEVVMSHTAKDELGSQEEGETITLYEVTFKPIKTGVVTIKSKVTLE